MLLRAELYPLWCCMVLLCSLRESGEMKEGSLGVWSCACLPGKVLGSLATLGSNRPNKSPSIVCHTATYLSTD